MKVPMSLSTDQLRCSIMEVMEECRCLKRMITILNQKRELTEKAHTEDIAALQKQIDELKLLLLQKSISDTDDYEVIPRS